MDTRVIRVADLKTEVKFDLWGYWGHLEAAMASGAAVKMAVLGNMHIDMRVIRVVHFEIVPYQRYTGITIGKIIVPVQKLVQ